MQLNKDEKSYINIIEKKLKIEVKTIKKINKGTLSKVFLLNEKYILKIADFIFIKREIIYFKNNKSDYNEKLIYKDYKNRFIVYKYIKGNEIKELTKESADSNLEIIINMTKNYKKTYRKKFGYIYEGYNSWYDFLESEIEFNHDYLPEEFKKTQEVKVYKALENIKNAKIDVRYIHGDLGVHNIIFNDQKIKGIIDPTTMIGDYRYDIIYFIFSSSKIEKHINYRNLVNLLGKDVINLIVILLYSRISKLYKYSSNDDEKKYFESLWYKLKGDI